MLYNQMLNPTASTQTVDLPVGGAPRGVDAPADHMGWNLVQCQGANVRVTFEGISSGAGLLMRPGDILQFSGDGMNQASFAADGLTGARVYVMHHN